MSTLTGGCLCGSVRYRLTGDPVVSRICWCRDCQRMAANGTVNAIFPASAIDIEGELAQFVSVAASGNQVRRRFCSRCGCHLFADNTGRAGFTVVRIGTLDEPSAITPTANIWTASAPAWACFDTGLQGFDAQPQQIQPPPSVA